MKIVKLSKVIINFFLILWIVASCFIPLKILAQSVVNPCWTEQDCSSAKGVWGKSVIESKDGVSGCGLDGGEVIGGICKNGKSTAINPKTNKEVCQPEGTSTGSTAKCYSKPPEITLQVPVPGMPQKFSGGMSQYLVTFYRFFVGAIAVMAVVMVMWGGFKRIYGAGSPEKIKDANDTIVSAISGLVIALLSYTLLNLVNPKLVNFSSFAVEMPKKQGFGEWCDDKVQKDNKPIDCGVIYNDTNAGYKCRGKYCPSGSGGCLPDPNKPKTDDIVSYSCQENSVACKKITDNNVEQFHGSASEEHDVYESACNVYSKDNSMCTWVEIAGTFNNDDHCNWYTKSDRDTYCAKLTSEGKTTCDAFNGYVWAGTIGIPYNTTTNIDFAACHRDIDWCNFGCKVVWKDLQFWGIPITFGQAWHCEPK